MILPRFLRRRLRPMWLATAALAAWTNRRDVARWLRFTRRSIAGGRATSPRDLVTEARLRLAVTMNPLLRRDDRLDDVELVDGTVIVRTTDTAWPSGGDRLRALAAIPGVVAVELRSPQVDVVTAATTTP